MWCLDLHKLGVIVCMEPNSSVPAVVDVGNKAG
jgi:hypothetical protein